jgi:ribulose-5-phosphate 4-epimerase/fuculose-1-phosphate aldolase
MSPKQPKLPGTAVDRLSATYHYLLRKKKEPVQHESGAMLNREVRDAIVPPLIRQEMVTVLESCSDLGLCIGKLSEASLYVQDNNYLVTRHGSGFHQISDKDLFLATTNSKSLISENQNPKYWNWHLAAYENNSSNKAVILAQPTAVMAVAIKGVLPKPDLMSEAAEIVGQIHLCLPDINSISEGISRSNHLIIPNIGILSYGETLSDVVINLEIINRCCEISLLIN